MKTVRFQLKPLRELFERLRAVTMPEMKAALGTEVDVTVFRKLTQLPYRTSYSHRGGFYTLEGIAQFDAQGLWCCRGAGFSRYGTLLNTAQALVRAAPSGYFADELEAQLCVSVKDALRHLVNKHRAARVPIRQSLQTVDSWHLRVLLPTWFQETQTIKGTSSSMTE